LNDPPESEIINDQRVYTIESDTISAVIAKIKQLLHVSGAELSLVLVTDEKIRELNSTYRSVDEPTDVLSFPQHEDGIAGISRLLGLHQSAAAHHQPVLLGDVVISTETVRRRELTDHVEANQEFLLLLVHGILHLLGYNHELSDDEQRMNALQSDVLGQLSFDGAPPRLLTGC